MKIAILSKSGRASWLAWALRKLGHKVSFKVIRSSYKEIWQGIEIGQIDKIPDGRNFDLIVFDGPGGGRTADRFRAHGMTVLGSSVIMDSLAEDPEMAEPILGQALLPSTEQEPQSFSGSWCNDGQQFNFVGVLFKRALAGGYGKKLDGEIITMKLTSSIKIDTSQVSGMLIIQDGRILCELEDHFYALAKLVPPQCLLLHVDEPIRNDWVCSIRFTIEPYPVTASKITPFVNLELSESQVLNDLYLYDIFYKNGLHGGGPGGGFIGCVYGFGATAAAAYHASLANVKILKIPDVQVRALLTHEIELLETEALLLEPEAEEHILIDEVELSKLADTEDTASPLVEALLEDQLTPHTLHTSQQTTS